MLTIVSPRQGSSARAPGRRCHCPPQPYRRYSPRHRRAICHAITEIADITRVMSKIPLYLFRYLKIYDDENMTLRPADLLNRHCRTICHTIAAISIISQIVVMV